MPAGLRLYAGTQNGLQILRGVGDVWTPLFTHFPDQLVQAVVGSRRSPEVVFAGVVQDALYRTADGGRRWQRVLDADVRWITIDPTDDRVVYAGVQPVALFRSEDGGFTWEELTGLQALPEEVRAHWGFPVPPHQGRVRHIFVDPADPADLILCLEHGGLVRSRDRGATWADVSEGIDLLDIHMLACAPTQEYFLGTSRGFYRSDNPDHGWRRAEDCIASDYFHDVVVLPGELPTLFLAACHGTPPYWERPTGAEGRIYRSEDGGRCWRQVGAGLPRVHRGMCWQLALNPYDGNSLLAAFGDVDPTRKVSTPGTGAIYVTYDRGDSWEEIGQQRLSTGPRTLPAIGPLWAGADA